MNSSLFKIHGFLRLGKGEGIGVPVFCSEDTNGLYIPITSDGLTIIDFTFVEFDLISSILIKHPSDEQRFSVGDPIPIPVWTQGKLEVVKADANIGDFVDRTGSNATLTRLERTLRRAQKSVEQDKRFKEIYSFLKHPPTPDRYWVKDFSSYLELAKNHRDRTRDVYPEFGGLALNWAQRCAHRAETATVAGFVETLLKAEDPSLYTSSSVAAVRHLLRKPSAVSRLRPQLKDMTLESGASGVLDLLDSDELTNSFVQFFERAIISGKMADLKAAAEIVGRSTRLSDRMLEVAHGVAGYRSQRIHDSLNRIYRGHELDADSSVRRMLADLALSDIEVLEVLRYILFPLEPRTATPNVFQFEEGVVRDLENIAGRKCQVGAPNFKFLRYD